MESKMIGSKIAEARKKINISQAQLAQRLFISPQAVGKWERGESFPDILTFNRLAQILGVDLNYFSESFTSVSTEMEVEKTVVTPAAELSSKERQHKHRWDMSRGNWVDADFSGMKNLQEKFSSSNMQRCQFVGSDLSGLLLKSNAINGCDFSGSDLSCSHMINSSVVNNQFKDCSLQAAEFIGSSIKGCDFSGADFSEALFKSSAFTKNTLEKAVLKQTSFNATSLADIVFEGIVQDCYFENCAFSRVTFQQARLINTFFKCKSLKKLRFIDCEADRMSYAFLKNGKADLSGIRLIMI